jgi:transcriptional regulator with XRE-family HTH domain
MEQWTDVERAAFGRRLAAARADKQMTQTEVGVMFGLGKAAVSSWEKGRNSPTAEQLARLSAEYGSPVEWLLLSRRPDLAVLMTPKARRIAELYDECLARDPGRAQVMYATVVALAGGAGDPVMQEQTQSEPTPSPAHHR